MPLSSRSTTTSSWLVDKKEKDGEDGNNDETARMKMPLPSIQQFLKQETSTIVHGSLGDQSNKERHCCGFFEFD
jgi:hypothetical protein